MQQYELDLKSQLISAWLEKSLQKMVQSHMQLIQMINWKPNYRWSIVVLTLLKVKNGDFHLIVYDFWIVILIPLHHVFNLTS